MASGGARPRGAAGGDGVCRCVQGEKGEPGERGNKGNPGESVGHLPHLPSAISAAAEGSSGSGAAESQHIPSFYHTPFAKDSRTRPVGLSQLQLLVLYFSLTRDYLS